MDLALFDLSLQKYKCTSIFVIQNGGRMAVVSGLYRGHLIDHFQSQCSSGVVKGNPYKMSNHDRFHVF